LFPNFKRRLLFGIWIFVSLLKKTFFLILFTGSVSLLFSQKIIEREIDVSNFNGIEIITKTIYSIKISTTKTEKVSIQTKIEGENFEQVMLTVFTENNLLKLDAVYPSYFEATDDKLAAHKVLAIEMKVIITEGFSVYINSSLASVSGNGNYKNFDSFLNEGNCLLENFTGNANLQTKKGWIHVFVNEYLSESFYAEAKSKKGKVINTLAGSGKYKIYAESVMGNISLQKD
jgi:hypothetical protein